MFEHEHEHGHFSPHTHRHRHYSKPTLAHEQSGMGSHAHEHPAEAAPPSDPTACTFPSCSADDDCPCADPAPPSGLDGWKWECASCDRPVPPMGMCETCGVFGVMRLSDDG